MKTIVALVLLAAWSTSCFAETYTLVRIDDPQRLELFLRDDTGTPFHRFEKLDACVLLATQSGPLLVEHGVIHGRLSAASKFIRNGVGVTGNTAVFVISNVPVSLRELAIYFRDELHCEDALYLDGTVSALYAPDLGRAIRRSTWVRSLPS